MPPALPAVAPAVAAEVGVLRRVRVPSWAVGFAGPVVPAVPDCVPVVLGAGVPPKVAQVVVGRVGVRVMAPFFPRQRGSHESGENQAVDSDLAPGVAGEGDRDVPTGRGDGLEQLPSDHSRFAGGAGDAAIQ